LETRRVPQVSLLRPGILLGKAYRVRLKARTSRKMCFSAACLAAEGTVPSAQRVLPEPVLPLNKPNKILWPLESA